MGEKINSFLPSDINTDDRSLRRTLRGSDRWSANTIPRCAVIFTPTQQLNDLKTILKNTAKDVFIYLILCAAVFLMLKIITEHFTFKSDVGFLAVKQEYVNNNVWRIAFYVHVFTSIFTLLAAFTQFSNYILKEYRTLHRIMGRIYVFAVLFINFPSGMLLAFNANGQLPTRIAFIILDSLWFWFTLKAFIEIRRGDITAHKKFMIRSYALTFSAIMLRLWKIILSNSFTIDPETLYMIDAWMGFVPNLLFAEWYIRRNIKQTKPRLTS